MITLTPEAAQHVQQLLARDGASTGLRFGVRESGCSGYAYLLDVAAAPADGDHVHEEHGVRVFIADAHMPFVRGAVIRFKDDLMETGLAVDNPNAKRACGCGSSFDV